MDETFLRMVDDLMPLPKVRIKKSETVSLDDMEAGRLKTFNDKDSLRKHLQLLTSKVIAAG